MAEVTLLGGLFVIVPSAEPPEQARCAQAASVFVAARLGDKSLLVCPSAPAQSDQEGEQWRAFHAAAFATLSELLRPAEEARVRVRLICLDQEALLLVPSSEVERAITALTRAGHRVETPRDDQIVVKCSWRMPEGGHAQAAFLAQVVTYDPNQDRWLVRFQDVRILSAVDEASRALIQSKVGSWAWVPSEARQGMALPLKYETLTGRVRWFYAQDPRLRD